MTRRVHAATLGEEPVTRGRWGNATDGACDGTAGGTGSASCGIECRSGGATPRARSGSAAFRRARPGLTTLTLLALAVPAGHGQPAPAPSAAGRAAEPAQAAAPRASAASSRGRTEAPPYRGGSQSEAMHACRSLPDQQAQHDCMLRHQAMPPYGEGGGGSAAPPRRRP
jgi:hypothetical protein